MNCTNVSLKAKIKMAENQYLTFNVPLRFYDIGCIFYLNEIPLTDHLTSDQMDELLLSKPPDYPELYSRIVYSFYISQSTTNTSSQYVFRRINSNSEISTAGLTMTVNPAYIEMNLGDNYYDTFQIVQYFDGESILNASPFAKPDAS